MLLALAVVFAVGCVKKDPTTDIKMKDVTDITASRFCEFAIRKR